jgi:hypothetical protein
MRCSYSSYQRGSLAVAQSSGDKESEAQIRAALADWVSATNRRDGSAANTIWAQNVVEWFPKAPESSLRK